MEIRITSRPTPRWHWIFGFIILYSCPRLLESTKVVATLDDNPNNNEWDKVSVEDEFKTLDDDINMVKKLKMMVDMFGRIKRDNPTAYEKMIHLLEGSDTTRRGRSLSEDIWSIGRRKKVTQLEAKLDNASKCKPKSGKELVKMFVHGLNELYPDMTKMLYEELQRAVDSKIRKATTQGPTRHHLKLSTRGLDAGRKPSLQPMSVKRGQIEDEGIPTPCEVVYSTTTCSTTTCLTTTLHTTTTTTTTTTKPTCTTLPTTTICVPSTCPTFMPVTTTCATAKTPNPTTDASFSTSTTKCTTASTCRVRVASAQNNMDDRLQDFEGRELDHDIEQVEEADEISDIRTLSGTPGLPRSVPHGPNPPRKLSKTDVFYAIEPGNPSNKVEENLLWPNMFKPAPRMDGRNPFENPQDTERIHRASLSMKRWREWPPRESESVDADSETENDESKFEQSRLVSVARARHQDPQKDKFRLEPQRKDSPKGKGTVHVKVEKEKSAEKEKPEEKRKKDNESSYIGALNRSFVKFKQNLLKHNKRDDAIPAKKLHNTFFAGYGIKR